MSDAGYKIRDQNAIHFITFTVVQWIDVFTRNEYRDILIDSINYCRKEKGLFVKAWCFMPNHLHFIIRAREGHHLSDILRDFKKFTSFKILSAIKENSRESRKNWMLWIFRKAGEDNKRNTDYQFWQQDNHPVECSTPDIFDSKMNYLHENPVRAGLVWRAEDYKYSSAIDYLTERKGLIEIDY